MKIEKSLEALTIIDTGENYIIQTSKYRNKSIQLIQEQHIIEYGEFLLALANIDYEYLNKCTNNFSHQFTEKMENTCSPNVSSIKMIRALESLIPLFRGTFSKEVYDSIKTYHLTDIEKEYIALLITNECVCRSINNRNKDYNEMPVFNLLAYEPFQEGIRNVLFEREQAITAEIHKLLFDIELKHSVVLCGKENPLKIYSVYNISELFALDVLNYIKTKSTAQICPMCNRTFFTQKRTEEKYCIYPNENGKTCREQSLQHRLNTHPFEDIKYKARRRFKNALRGYNGDENSAKKLYANFTYELTSQAELCKFSDDKDRLQSWINTHMFRKEK